MPEKRSIYFARNQQVFCPNGARGASFSILSPVPTSYPFVEDSGCQLVWGVGLFASVFAWIQHKVRNAENHIFLEINWGCFKRCTVLTTLKDYLVETSNKESNLRRSNCVLPFHGWRSVSIASRLQFAGLLGLPCMDCHVGEQVTFVTCF